MAQTRELLGALEEWDEPIGWNPYQIQTENAVASVQPSQNNDTFVDLNKTLVMESMIEEKECSIVDFQGQQDQTSQDVSDLVRYFQNIMTDQPQPAQPTEKKKTRNGKKQPHPNKNILIHYQTFLKNHFQSRARQHLSQYFRIIPKRSYPSLLKFSRLFSSRLQAECIRFFENYCQEAILNSKVDNKTSLLQHLVVMRQAARSGELLNLKIPND